VRARRHPNGTHLIVRWDTITCTADDYDVLFGDLAAVGSLAIDSAACSIGTAGFASVAMPPGDAFFLVVAESAGNVEGSHGYASDGTPRDSSGVGLCGIVARALDGTCP
jgi:hypothetical protein